jgi:hypothetical protein
VSTSRSTPPDLVLGEVATEHGFHRVSLAPEPLALARLSALLLDVATDGSALLREGLEGFKSWRFLASLCGTAWTTGARRSSGAARRVLQRRLRVLGTRPITVATAGQLPIGAPAHVCGTIVPLPGTSAPASSSRLPAHISHIAHIWSLSAMTTDNVRCTVEDGHDFFLTDEEGETLRVIAARGVLVNADTLEPGDRISAFGFVDRVLDSTPRGVDALTRGATSLALRSGDDLPLLLRRASQERHGEHRTIL